MSTKNNPGQFDCYAKADPDEPLFALLAKDPIAPYLVQIWKAVRSGDQVEAYRAIYDAILALRRSGRTLLPAGCEKATEAVLCSREMQRWHNDKIAPIHQDPTL